jgi:hypothetical protein
LIRHVGLLLPILLVSFFARRFFGLFFQVPRTAMNTMIGRGGGILAFAFIGFAHEGFKSCDAAYFLVL